MQSTQAALAEWFISMGFDRELVGNIVQLGLNEEATYELLVESQKQQAGLQSSPAQPVVPPSLSIPQLPKPPQHLAVPQPPQPPGCLPPLLPPQSLQHLPGVQPPQPLGRPPSGPPSQLPQPSQILQAPQPLQSLERPQPSQTPTTAQLARPPSEQNPGPAVGYQGHCVDLVPERRAPGGRAKAQEARAAAPPPAPIVSGPNQFEGVPRSILPQPAVRSETRSQSNPNIPQSRAVQGPSFQISSQCGVDLPAQHSEQPRRRVPNHPSLPDLRKGSARSQRQAQASALHNPRPVTVGHQQAMNESTRPDSMVRIARQEGCIRTSMAQSQHLASQLLARQSPGTARPNPVLPLQAPNNMMPPDSNIVQPPPQEYLFPQQPLPPLGLPPLAPPPRPSPVGFQQLNSFMGPPPSQSPQNPFGQSPFGSSNPFLSPFGAQFGVPSPFAQMQAPLDTEGARERLRARLLESGCGEEEAILLSENCDSFEEAFANIQRTIRVPSLQRQPPQFDSLPRIPMLQEPGLLAQGLERNHRALLQFFNDLQLLYPPRQTVPQGVFDNLKTKQFSQEETDQTQCMVCLEDFEVDELIKILPCLHEFHKDCIRKWLDGSILCPLCRKEIK